MLRDPVRRYAMIGKVFTRQALSQLFESFSPADATPDCKPWGVFAQALEAAAAMVYDSRNSGSRNIIPGTYWYIPGTHHVPGTRRQLGGVSRREAVRKVLERGNSPKYNKQAAPLAARLFGYTYGLPPREGILRHSCEGRLRRRGPVRTSQVGGETRPRLYERKYYFPKAQQARPLARTKS